MLILLEKLKLQTETLLKILKKIKLLWVEILKFTLKMKMHVNLLYIKYLMELKLFCDNDEDVKKGKKICEWDPYTLPVIAEKSGVASYMDLVDGVSLAETMDDATGISSKSVLDWRSQSKNTELKPRITLRDEKGNVVKKADDNEARYYLVPDSILSVNDGQKVYAGDVLARLAKRNF